MSPIPPSADVICARPQKGMAEGALFPKAGWEREREGGDKIDGLDGLAGLRKEKKLQHDSSSEKLSLFAKLADAVGPFYAHTQIHTSWATTIRTHYFDSRIC